MKSFEQMVQEVRPLIENGWYEAASCAFEKIVEAYPDKAMAYQELVARYQKKGAGDSNAKSLEDMYQEIEPLVSRGQTDAAIYALEELLATHPKFAMAHNDLAVLYYTQGDKTAAQLHYEHAARFAPDNMSFQKNLADFYFVELNRIQKALDIYLKVLETNPEDVETLLTAGHLNVALQRFNDARRIYKHVLEIEPGNPDARLFKDALDNSKYEMVSEKSPLEIYQEIQPLLKNDHPKAAMEALQKLLAIHPDFALAHNDLGVLCYCQGEKEAARCHYERAVQLDPDNMTLQKNLADFYFVECNRVEEAMDIYVRILETHPADIETLMNAGHISAALQRFDDARTIYERVLKIEPLNTDARQGLENIDNRKKESKSGTATTNPNFTLTQGNSIPSVS